MFFFCCSRPLNVVTDVDTYFGFCAQHQSISECPGFLKVGTAEQCGHMQNIFVNFDTYILI